jgi:protein-tyrosine phosphatase
MAEGILREIALQKGFDIEVDSCGTSAYHIGEHPDSRAQKKAAEKGVDISMLKARQFRREDFDRFDSILVMDQSNYHDILKLSRTKKESDKVKAILDYPFPNEKREVPDPYYGGSQGFEEVFHLLWIALESFTQTHFYADK